MEYVKLPAERVAVLIGQKGKVKREIEKRGRVKLAIEGEEVAVKGKDAIAEWKARDVVKAVGRGFPPEKALKLLQEDYYFKLFNLREICRNENDVKRVKSRVIGKAGKSRRVIEELADVDIAVYGDTVGIVGGLSESSLAAEAIEMLIEGASHSRVYGMLERGRRRLKEERLQLWETRPTLKEST